MPSASKQPKSSLKKDGRIAKQQHGQRKLLSVKVTVLSVSGLHVEETSKKTSYFSSLGNKTLSASEKTNSSSTEDSDKEPQADNNERGRGRSRSRSLVRSLSRGRSKSASRGPKVQQRGRSRSKSRRNNKIKPIENDEQDPEFSLKDFDTTTVVASITKKGKKVVHVKSLPLSLTPPTSTNDANNEVGKSGNKSTSTAPAASSTDVVCWPEKGTSSYFTFQRYFPIEPHSTLSTASSSHTRYTPQLCPIEISLMKCGKMHKLGSAHVYVGGEENGEVSVNVPLVKCDKSFGKGMATMMMRGSSNNNSSSGNVSMMKIKGGDGTTIKCGLADRATLRVLIQVSDPKANNNISSMQRIQKVLSFEQDGDVGKSRKVRVNEPSFFGQVLCCCLG